MSANTDRLLWAIINTTSRHLAFNRTTVFALSLLSVVLCLTFLSPPVADKIFIVSITSSEITSEDRKWAISGEDKRHRRHRIYAFEKFLSENSEVEEEVRYLSAKKSLTSPDSPLTNWDGEELANDPITSLRHLPTGNATSWNNVRKLIASLGQTMNYTKAETRTTKASTTAPTIPTTSTATTTAVRAAQLFSNATVSRSNFLTKFWKVPFVRNFTTLLEPPPEMTSSFCDSAPAPSVVVGILCSPNQYAERNATRRKAWFKGTPTFRALPVFLLGAIDSAMTSSNLTSSPRQEDVALEHEFFGDILQQNFLDSYFNLTYKVLMGMEWAALCCPRVTWFLKLDINHYDVDWAAIEEYAKGGREGSLMIDGDGGGTKTSGRNEIAMVNSSTKGNGSNDGSNSIEGNPITKGKGNSGSGILCPNIYPQNVPSREPDNRYFTPLRDYPDEVFPTFCQGTSYAFPMAVIGDCLRCSRQTRFFWLEDVYITGILRELIGYLRLDYLPYLYLAP